MAINWNHKTLAELNEFLSSPEGEAASEKYFARVPGDMDVAAAPKSKPKSEVESTEVENEKPVAWADAHGRETEGDKLPIFNTGDIQDAIASHRLGFVSHGAEVEITSQQNTMYEVHTYLEDGTEINGFMHSKHLNFDNPPAPIEQPAV